MRAAILCAAVICVTSCGTDLIPAPERRDSAQPSGLDSRFVVSDAAPQSISSSSAALASQTSETFSYVSMPAGTAPEGVVAAIRNRNRSTSVTVTLAAGGFDPVPVAGQAGDTLELSVRDANGDVLLSSIAAIPVKRRPVVIRSSPPPRKRDVPLNAIITVVFSEPMDPQTVTVGSFRLSRNTEVVAAQVVLDATGTRAELIPQDSLAASSDYTVLLASTLADRSGDRLDPYTFDFTSAPLPQPPGPEPFVLTGFMTVARAQHEATLLLDGRVLITGGSAISTAEVYDPTTGTFAPTGSMLKPRVRHSATLLQNGQVLIVGGYNVGGLAGGAELAELYDPAAGTFAATGGMLRQQFVQSSTLLPNGTVLVAGDTTAELYDPATGTFRRAGPYARVPTLNQAVLLHDGRVLLAGDEISQIYDPERDAFELTPPLMTGGVVGQTSTLLDDGRVLIAGGYSLLTERRFASAVLFDPASNTFVRTGDMLDDRDNHAAARLPDGRVLIIGGETAGNGWFAGSLRTAELYDPASGTFSFGGWMFVPRSSQRATSLRTGDVLITGGMNYYNCDIGCHSMDELPSAELHRTPPSMPAVSQVRHAP